MNTVKEILKEHWAFRGQIIKLAKVDLIKTYRGAALGWAWAVIKPTVTIFVYWFAFAIGLRQSKTTFGPNGKYGFFFWLAAGIVPWFYMQEMLTYGIESIRKYSYLVTKMKFPISTVPTFVSCSKLFVNMMMTLILIVIFWCAGFPVDIYFLQLPLYTLLMFIGFTCWGLFASLLSVVSKDFANLVKSFVTAIFWLSGILWNVQGLKVAQHPKLRVLKEILLFNPVTYLSNGYRNVFIYKRWIWQDCKINCYYAIVTIIMMLLAIWAYKRIRKDIPDLL